MNSGEIRFLYGIDRWSIILGSIPDYSFTKSKIEEKYNEIIITRN
nr:MAG TPA: hypothetical protein [Caudoviricetes sp.]